MTSIHTAALVADDFEAWKPLWDGYLEFYETTLAAEVSRATFDRMVARDRLAGALARTGDGAAVGMVTWLWHPGTWDQRERVYLEDFFVAPTVRGGGIGRALINHVVDDARARGASSVYWHTQRSNTTARTLYDTMATDTDYMHYEIKLD